MKRRNILGLILLICTFIFVRGDVQNEPEIELYKRVLKLVLQNYVEVKTPQELEEKSLRGAIDAIDSQSSYISPSDITAYKGLGEMAAPPFNIAKMNGYANILSVAKEGELLGMQADDRIRFIGDTSTFDLDEIGIQMALHGAAGKKITITVYHGEDKEPVKKEITLGFYEKESSVINKGNNTILKITSFIGKNEKAIFKEVALCKGLLYIDLRGNTSSDYQSALRWASALSKKEILFKFKKQGDKVEDYKSLMPGLPHLPKIIALIDKTTARAGEILALSLKNSGNLITGENSLGLCSMTKDYILSNGGILNLTGILPLNQEGKPVTGNGLQVDLKFDIGKSESIDDFYNNLQKAVEEKSKEKNGKEKEKTH